MITLYSSKETRITIVNAIAQGGITIAWRMNDSSVAQWSGSTLVSRYEPHTVAYLMKTGNFPNFTYLVIGNCGFAAANGVTSSDLSDSQQETLWIANWSQVSTFPI